jgi:hypothetical protein
MMIGKEIPRELGKKPASVPQEVAGFKPKHPNSDVRNRNKRKEENKKQINQR